MRRWQRKSLSFVLTVVLLFSTISVSGATGSNGAEQTDREMMLINGNEAFRIASSSNSSDDWMELVNDVELMAEGTKIPITGVTIKSKPTKPVTTESDKFQLRAGVEPQAAATAKAVSYAWDSTEPAVATVDTNGWVTVVGEGTTTIKITIKGKLNSEYEGEATDRYELTVVSADESETTLTSVKITDKPTDSIKVGDEYFKLGYSVTPEKATEDKNVKVEWTSGKPEVASIDEADGTVTIIGAGATTITVKATGLPPYTGTVTDSFELTVEPKTTENQITGVTITNKPISPLKVGGTPHQLKRTVTPVTKFVTVVWTSSNPEVATIDMKLGMVTPKAVGTTTITATANGHTDFTGTATDSFELTVTPETPAVSITGVTITSKPTTSKHVGDAPFKLRRDVVPSDATVTAAWTSTNPLVATIDINGNVTLVGEGNTTIKLEVTGTGSYKGTATDSYELTVLPERGAPVPITKVAITGKPTAPLYVGDPSFKVRYTMTPYGAATTPVWTSSNPDAASIDPYGNITMVGAGKTTIKLEVTGKDGYEGTVTDSFSLTVLPTTLIVSRSDVFLDRGESAEIAVKFGPDRYKLMTILPTTYQADGAAGEVAWPSEYLSTSRVENGRFPDDKLIIKIDENMPEQVLYGNAKMQILLLKQDAMVEDGQPPASEDILMEREITIYFREKKESVLPPVKPGIPRVDRLKDELEKIDFNQLTSLEKKELAAEVIESLEKQKIMVKHTIGNKTLEENLLAVEEKLKELLDITPEKSGDSDKLDAISFTGALFNVPSGKTPILVVENESADVEQTSGMGVSPDCTPVAMDIKLTTEDGTIVSSLNVPMQFRIRASELGLKTTSKIVIKHIKNNGASSLLPYQVEGEDLVFWVSDFSTFVFANGSASAGGGTSSGGGGGGGGGSSSGGGGGGSGATRSVVATATPTGSWRQEAGGWKFLYTDGTPITNRWVELTWNGKAEWYHFDAQGYADGGWLQEGNHTYYLNPLHNGQFGMMMTGWQQIEGKWYYFQPQAGGPRGAMLRNMTTPDGFYVGVDGVRR